MVCRDRIGYLSSTMFNLWTCSMCYRYLYRGTGNLRPEGYKLKYVNNFTSDTTGFILPDIMNNTVISFVCNELDTHGEDCDRWLSCCRSSIQCCKEQERVEQGDVQQPYNGCPPTWDGFTCVPHTNGGKRLYLDCPPYISRHRVQAQRGTVTVHFLLHSSTKSFCILVYVFPQHHNS